MALDKERAKQARQTVHFYTSNFGFADDPLHTNIIDLLADIQHLCAKEDLDFEDLARQATNHFNDDETS